MAPAEPVGVGVAAGLSVTLRRPGAPHPLRWAGVEPSVLQGKSGGG